MKKELTIKEWKRIGEKAKEVVKAHQELLRSLSGKVPKTYYENKWFSASKAFGRLRSHLDDIVCGKFLDHPDKEITGIFYGTRDRESVISESLHLLEANKEKCEAINKKEDKSPNDIADFLISLHLVMEISINALIRDLVVNNLQKTIDKSKIVDNLDRISFIDKTILFVYMEKYDFSDSIENADKHHSLIGLLKSFSQTRNLLMHGSMIGDFLDGQSSTTSTVSKLTDSHFNEQVERFKKIYDGLIFYLEHLKHCNSDVDYLKRKFLNYNFLIK